MTWIDIVQEYFPGMDADVCGYILWNETCYGFGTEAQIREQLKELAAQSNENQRIKNMGDNGPLQEQQG